MIQFNYTPNLTGRILKTEDEQFDNFFYQGHPSFLIPDFNQYPDDIWLSYLSFLEKNHSCEIYDQDGGEITSHQIIDYNTGLTKCTYSAYGIMLNESDDPQDVDIEIEGYVMEESPMEYVFMVTKIFESYKMSI